MKLSKYIEYEFKNYVKLNIIFRSSPRDWFTFERKQTEDIITLKGTKDKDTK